MLNHFKQRCLKKVQVGYGEENENGSTHDTAQGGGATLCFVIQPFILKVSPISSPPLYIMTLARREPHAQREYGIYELVLSQYDSRACRDVHLEPLFLVFLIDRIVVGQVCHAVICKAEAAVVL